MERAFHISHTASDPRGAPIERPGEANLALISPCANTAAGRLLRASAQSSYNMFCFCFSLSFVHDTRPTNRKSKSKMLSAVTGVDNRSGDCSTFSRCSRELEPNTEARTQQNPTGSLAGAANRISRLSTHQRQKTIDKGPHIVQDGGGQLSDPPPNSEKERPFHATTPTTVGSSTMRHV